MAISAAFLSGSLGSESRRSKRVSELWSITGSTGVATDTVAITTRYMKKPVACLGGMFSYSVSGQVITLTLKANIGNDTVAVEIIGDY